MRILALSNLYPPDCIGGYEIACGQAVDALIARGHEVKVLTSVPRRLVPTLAHVERVFELASIYDLEYMAGVIPLVRHEIHTLSNQINAHNCHLLLQTLRDWRPDVVFLFNILGIGGLGILGCLHYLKIPWVWQLGDIVPPSVCTPWYGFEPKLARLFETQLSGTYIACSRRLLEQIEALGLRLRGRLEILPHWVQGERPARRTTFYHRGEHLRVVAVGVLTEQKGTGLLVEAARLLIAAGHEDFSIDFYGASHDPSFEDTARRLGLARWLRFKGTVPHAELLGLLGRYDVLAFPTSEEEPFGMAPLEAAAHGCVPIIPRECGIGEWLVGDLHCLKCERSAEAFSRVFLDIIEGRIDLEPLARRAAAVAWGEFRQDTVVDRVERVLERAARQPRDGAGTFDDAYRLAKLADRMAQAYVQEAT